MISNQDKHQFDIAFQGISKKSWQCMTPGCSAEAINSHTLQKNGILSQIESDNHIIELKPVRIWEMENEGPATFSKVGLNVGFSFPGFCSVHDNMVFEPIEKSNPDFDNRKVQVLFCYRGLCQEIRRKEQVKSFLESLLNKAHRFTTLDVNETFADYSEGLGLGIENLNFFKSELEKELVDPSKKLFDFCTTSSDRFEVCTSAPINVKNSSSLEANSVEQYRFEILNNRLPTTFINVFPTSNRSIWIIGHHKDYPSDYFNSLQKNLLDGKFKEIINELFLLRMEYWCMSQLFYEQYLEPKIDQIRRLQMDNVLNFELNSNLKLNIFS